jgi:benzoate-CoA ligase
MSSANLAAALVDGAVARGLGEQTAIREPKRAWSYGRLAEESARVASALAELGVKPGERVGLLLHDSAELAACFLGAVRLGAVPAPISVLLRPLEVRALFADAAPVAVVVSSDLAPGLEEIRGDLPSLRHLLAVGGARPGQLDLHALTAHADARFPPYAPGAGEPAFFLYSAGPTGSPKRVAHGHEAAAHAFRAYGEGVLRLGASDRVFTTSSLASAYGLCLGLLFPLAAGASTFLLPGRPRPRVLLDVMAAFRPTVFAAAPSLYGQLLHDWRGLSSPRPRPFSTVRVAVSGAEPLPPRLERRLRDELGVSLVHGFGVTEALSFVLSNRIDQRKEGSSGRPVDGIEARVVGSDGAALPLLEIGALEVRGPTVAGGGDDGWLRVGDRFFVDDEGYFFHCGRADDLFKVGGRWVSPDEVERTLLAHPAVWECAVVEGHDDDGLPLPVAYVVPNVGHAATAELAEQLMNFVKREIAPWKYPRAVEFVGELPKDERGVVQRWRLLRDPLAAAR